MKHDIISMHQGVARNPLVRLAKPIDFSLLQGEHLAVVGPNGAGKTTTLNAICGLVRPRAGRVLYRGADIAKTPTHELVKQGLVMAPEGRGIFPNLTVAENMDLGAYTRTDKAGIKADAERGYTLFPRLKERINQKAGTPKGDRAQQN